MGPIRWSALTYHISWLKHPMPPENMSALKLMQLTMVDKAIPKIREKKRHNAL